MWWISKKGVISGPFERDQVEKRISLGMIGSLDRVSEDRRNWTYVRDSDLWHQERTIPEDLAPPRPSPKAKIGLRRVPAAAAASPSFASASPTAAPVADIGADSERSHSATAPFGNNDSSAASADADPTPAEEVPVNVGLPTSEFSIWKLIFGGVFLRHGDAAVSSILNGDGRRSLPEGFYPKTWLWSRVWIWATVLSVITLVLAFYNSRILPGFIMLAAFGVPVSMVLLFLECDVTRRVSIWKALGVFIVGGVFSILATSILNVTGIGATLNGALGAGSAGPIEETAKLVILLPFLANPKRYPSVLNGLLLGAAVGAGFAAFETAGYIFNDAFMTALVNGAEWEEALGESTGLAILRAIFSPFCHIAWTASIGGALWKARGESGSAMSAFMKLPTWGVILLAMLLHLLWNWGLGGLSLIGVAPWAIIVNYLAHGYGKPSTSARSVAPQQRTGTSKGAVIAIAILAAVIGALVIVVLGMAFDGDEGAAPVAPSGETSSQPQTSQQPDKPRQTGNSFSTVQDKLVIIECGGGSGSGFLAKMDGKVYLVSNEHVLRGDDMPKATLLNGERLSLGAFSVAADRDLARFEVPGIRDGLEISTVMPTMSDTCAIYGNSGGRGVATELNGTIIGVGPKYLETDAEFVEGNSGSPVLNANGRVMGAADLVFNDKADSERDWGVKGTKFDAVRRFLVRLDGRVSWKTIDRREYEMQVRRLDEFTLFFDEYLWPYLAVDKVEKGKVNPFFNEQAQKKFGSDSYGFAECLVKVDKAYERRDRIESDYFRLKDEWAEKVEAARKDGVRESDIERFTDDYWLQNDMKGRWEKVKDVNRAFIQQLQQALALGKSFLAENRWDAAQLIDGHAVEDASNYGEGVNYWRDLMEWVRDDLDQRMRDLDKTIRKMEGRYDDEN